MLFFCQDIHKTSFSEIHYELYREGIFVIQLATLPEVFGIRADVWFYGYLIFLTPQVILNSTFNRQHVNS